MGAAEFKAKCLDLLDDVSATGSEYVVTKRGRPVARVIPVRSATGTSFGAWKGQVAVVGDIVHTDWSDEFEINASAAPVEVRPKPSAARTKRK